MQRESDAGPPGVNFGRNPLERLQRQFALMIVTRSPILVTPCTLLEEVGEATPEHARKHETGHEQHKCLNHGTYFVGVPTTGSPPWSQPCHRSCTLQASAGSRCASSVLGFVGATSRCEAVDQLTPARVFECR